MAFVKTSEPTSEMDTAWTQRPVGRFVTVLSSGLVMWSSSVKSHSESIIGISVTWPSRFHTVNTLSLITAVSPGYSGEALCLFCSELSCRGRGTVEWLHLTRSSLHKQRRQTKEDAWLPTGAKTDPEISASHIGEAGKATVIDCGIFLFVVSLHSALRWSMAASEHARQSFYFEKDNQAVFHL